VPGRHDVSGGQIIRGREFAPSFVERPRIRQPPPVFSPQKLAATKS